MCVCSLATIMTSGGAMRIGGVGRCWNKTTTLSEPLFCSVPGIMALDETLFGRWFVMFEGRALELKEFLVEKWSKKFLLRRLASSTTNE